jgi:hypothetical protein
VIDYIIFIACDLNGTSLHSKSEKTEKIAVIRKKIKKNEEQLMYRTVYILNSPGTAL